MEITFANAHAPQVTRVVDYGDGNVFVYYDDGTVRVQQNGPAPVRVMGGPDLAPAPVVAMSTDEFMPPVPVPFELPELCQTEGEMRALNLLMGRLSREQKQSFAERRFFHCGPYYIGLQLNPIVFSRPLPRFYEVLVNVGVVDNSVVQRPSGCGCDLCRANGQDGMSDQIGPFWLCVYTNAGPLPWPDRVLAYKLAVEDGTIWDCAPGTFPTPSAS